MRQLLITVTLVGALAGSTFAGEIPTGGIAPPPPPGDSQTSSGQIPCDLTGAIPSDGFASQVKDTMLISLVALFSFVN